MLVPDLEKITCKFAALWSWNELPELIPAKEFQSVLKDPQTSPATY